MLSGIRQANALERKVFDSSIRRVIGFRVGWVGLGAWGLTLKLTKSVLERLPICQDVYVPEAASKTIFESLKQREILNSNMLQDCKMVMVNGNGGLP